MKKIFLFLAAMFTCFILIKAQNDTVYIMKNGAVVNKFNLSSDIDSVIFYSPSQAGGGSGGGTSNDAPYFNLTGVAFGIQGTVSGTVAAGYTAVYGGGVPKQYVYDSPLLGGLVGFDVILPPNYETNTSKRYPVIYHLHGKGENHTAYRYNGAVDTKIPGYMTNGTTPDFIFISVGGPIDCWWSDGINGSKAESHIITEILSLVDQKFRTLGTRESRAIMGFSMGGFGSHKMAIKYPQYFAVAATYCGGTYAPGKEVYQTNPEGFSGGFSSDFNTIWGTDAKYNSQDCGRALLSSKASDIKARGTTFVIHAGTAGDMFYTHNLSFKAELESYGIHTLYEEAPHGHDMNSIDAVFFNKILSNMTVN